MVSTAKIEPCGPVNFQIRPPGSKSITNRAIVCAALAEGESRLTGVLESEDTEVMIRAWQQLGLSLSHARSQQSLRVQGCGGQLPSRKADIYVANSGTTIRFLAAALAACHGEFVLDGVPRMRERPILDLVRALNALGAQVTCTNQEHPDCPPVKIDGHGLAGGEAEISGAISSQYLSGLMMAAPLADQQVCLRVTGELVSVPYVEMTAAVMKAFGADTQSELPTVIRVASQRYLGTDYAIEPDASAASYFWAAAAICGGQARVEGLSRSSLQGDVGFCQVLESMGVQVEYGQDAITTRSSGSLRGVDVDMANISDTVQTLAAVALFAEGPTNVRGVAHNRVKETDRIGDLATELRRLGARVDEREDGLTIHPPEKLQPAVIRTYGDHRMAMSMSLVGLQHPGVEIQDPGCTAKTYPQFWEDLATTCGAVIRRAH